MTYTGLPVLAGTTLPRPSSVDESPEAVRTGVQLAGGSLRAYNAGTRRVFELSWSRMTEENLAALRSITATAFVPYVHLDGSTEVVETSPPQASAVAGTDPVRFAVSLTLRGQAVT